MKLLRTISVICAFSIIIIYVNAVRDKSSQSRLNMGQIWTQCKELNQKKGCLSKEIIGLYDNKVKYKYYHSNGLVTAHFDTATVNINEFNFNNWSEAKWSK